MAIDPKKLEQVEKLLKRIQKNYEELGEKNPFKNFDASKIKDIDKEIEKLEVSLEGVQSKVLKLNTTFGDLTGTLKSIVQEFTKKDTRVKDLTKGMKGLVKQAQELAYEEEGSTKLSEKELKLILERAKKSRDLVKANAASLVQGKENAVWNEKLNRYIDSRTGKMVSLNQEEQDAIRLLNDEDNIQKDLIDKIEERLKKEQKLNKQMGLFGGIMKGIAKIPILGDVLDTTKILEKTRDVTEKTGSSLKGMSAGFKEIGKQAVTGLLNPVNLALGAITMLISAIVSADKEVTELAKNFGVSRGEAIKLSQSAREIADEYEGITRTDVLDAQKKLNEYFGTGAEFSKEIAGEFAQIQKRTGLSNKAMGTYSKLAMKSGKSVKATLNDVNLTVMEQNKQNKLALNIKDIQEGVAEASAAVKLQTKGSVKALANAVIEAKKLGTNLAQVEAISSSLLDFESSIQAELEAELLLGKEINLEAARAAALKGDQATVAKEIMKNQSIMNAFETDNVIQQEAAAKAIGLNRDQLADMILKQKEMQILQKAFGKDVKNISDAQEHYNDLRASGLTAEQAAAEVGDESLAKQLETQSNAEKMEETMNRVREIFVSLAEEVLPVISAIMTPIGFVIGSMAEGIKMFFDGIKKGNPLAVTLAGVLTMVALPAIISAIGAIFSTFALIPFGVGIPLAIATIAGMYSQLSKGKKQAESNMKDGVIGPGGEMVVSGPKGSIQLDKEDSIIAGTDLGGKKGKESGGEARKDPTLIAKIEQLISVNQQILAKSPVIEMGGNEVGQGINTAEREIQ